jgi:hypothetical protein
VLLFSPEQQFAFTCVNQGGRGSLAVLGMGYQFDCDAEPLLAKNALVVSVCQHPNLKFLKQGSGVNNLNST